MFVTTAKRKSPKGAITVVRLVHGYREAGKSKMKIIKTIGQSRDLEEIEYFRKIGKNLIEELKTGIRQNSVPPPPSVNLSALKGKSSINDGIEDILGHVYIYLGFDKIVLGYRKNTEWNQILKYCIFMRFLEPASKLRSIRLILNRFQKEISHDQVLKMMDHLSEKEDEIKRGLTSKMIEVTEGLDILLFDVTTLYFESTKSSDLRKFGFSKDGKSKEVQVVLALLTDSNGLPITYEVFPGNTSETKTFISSIEKIKESYGIKKVRVTADRAMFSDKNLSYFESKGSLKDGFSEYIVACPLRKLSKRQKEKILDKSNYTVMSTGMRFYEFNHEGRRVVVVYSTKRAFHQKHQREVLLDRIKKLENADGKIPNDKLSGNRGIKRYLRKSKEFTKLNKNAVLEDERWDGIFGVCTNISSLDPSQLFSSYKRLWKIEESFRINKHTLKMRPIYHRLTERIKAHLLICFLCYTILRYIEIFLRSKDCNYGSQKIIDILSEIESWILKDIKKQKMYIIPKEISEDGALIYKAFGVKRNEKPYRLTS